MLTWDTLHTTTTLLATSHKLDGTGLDKMGQHFIEVGTGQDRIGQYFIEDGTGVDRIGQYFIEVNRIKLE